MIPEREIKKYIMDWYIIYQGEQVGPLSKSQLAQYGLNPASMVWHAGMTDWMPAGNVPELADILETQKTYDAQQQPYGTQQPYGAQQPYGQQPYGAQQPPYGQPGYQQPYTSGKRIAAGVLAIVLGWLGIQYFICGKVGAGFITILLSLVTCGAWEIVTFVQGILMLCMSDQEFDAKYVYNDKVFPLF